MFILSKKADDMTFWATITGWRPAETPGGVKVKYEFDVQFRLIKTKDDDQPPTDMEWFKERVIGWRRIQDDERQDIPFSPEALEAMYELQWVRQPVILAYYKEIDGTKQRAKN